MKRLPRLAAAASLLLFAACDGDLAPSAKVHPLVVGDARLVGWTGEGACSHGEPAAGDGHRWCAFYRPSIVQEGTPVELWVVDATRAMAGESLPCDGSSSGCLRLTEKLFTKLRFQSPSHPEAHRFQGDTLLFLAEEHPDSGDLDRYEGYVWAWRPGWARARPLTTDRGVLCGTDPSGLFASCVDGASDKPLTFDLRAGPIVDREGALPPVIERVVAEQEGGLAWSAQFAGAGADPLFAFSSWRAGEGGESLRVVPLAEVGRTAPRTVVESGYFWTFSADGHSVFFLRGGARERERGEGTLWAADFPSGGSATEVARGVAAFEPLAGGGVAFLTDLRGLEGVLHVLPDPHRPEARFRLAPGAHAWYPIGDGHFTYVLQVDDEGERGLIGDNARGTSCILASRPDVTAYSAYLLPNLGSVMWAEPDPTDEGPPTTFMARPDDCGGVSVVGKGIQYVRPVGARGMMIGAADRSDSGTLDFSYLPAWDGRPVTGRTQPVLAGVDRNNVAVVGAGEAFVFGNGPDANGGRGLNVFGPLPRAR